MLANLVPLLTELEPYRKKTMSSNHSMNSSVQGMIEEATTQMEWLGANIIRPASSLLGEGGLLITLMELAVPEQMRKNADNQLCQPHRNDCHKLIQLADQIIRCMNLPMEQSIVAQLQVAVFHTMETITAIENLVNVKQVFRCQDPEEKS